MGAGKAGDGTPLFSGEELAYAINSFMNKKSPGPNSILAGVLKAVIKYHPQILQRVQQLTFFA